ncbi:putative U-box domain-containing protein 35-like [Capsicum annuum]|uniref:tRNA-guanine(15) transglycosylase-like domain-containing protein n=1 Tax=Capsicum annuum TaxID=4072 RepID=A0A2G2ZX44_CAPAN|nr:putative U-box domain-containing protein 35-like [Capsicum annuum]KAF3656218.1 putative U-box domain-containing protein 35-like [Capsicum annuum]PHT86538.1 hypothetical protein T459_08644 [Capsicum annuum]
MAYQFLSKGSLSKHLCPRSTARENSRWSMVNAGMEFSAQKNLNDWEVDTFVELYRILEEFKDGAVFGSVVGGSRVEQRRRCAQEVARRNVEGFWIGGFGLGESMEERNPLLRAVVDSLPEEKPRLISGLGLPGKKDISPIVDDCKCYTCQNHTKAYINHLLNVHEMLAHVLLEIHNTHHFLGFFRSIREAIQEGKFEQFRQKFIGSRHEHLFSAALSDQLDISVQD